MTKQSRVQIAATSTNNNIVAGDIVEFAQTGRAISFGFAAEGAGLLIDILIDSVLIAQGLTPGIGAAATAMPIYPDNFPVTDEVMAAGQRLTIRVQNPTGGALWLNFTLNITELG